MSVTTRLTNTSMEVEGCTFYDYNCTYTPQSENTVYIADIEEFSVLIDHSIYAPAVNIQKTGTDLPGALLDSNGDIMELNDPETVGVVGESDVIKIGTFLQAAGVSLDDPSPQSKFTAVVVCIQIYLLICRSGHYHYLSLSSLSLSLDIYIYI